MGHKPLIRAVQMVRYELCTTVAVLNSSFTVFYMIDLLLEERMQENHKL